jgi:Mn2+/Fe2+ NRAMP family transporter
MNEQDKAIEAVMNFTADGDEYHVVNHHPEFLNGSLYLIAFEDANKGASHCFVYMEKGVSTVCKNQALLNELVARKSKKIGIAAALGSIGGTEGLIALIITLTIVYLIVFRSSADVPKELWAALLAILAYYFGSKASKP